MSKLQLNWQTKWDGVSYQWQWMPLLNRYVFGHLCGGKTYSSFGLALFSSPVTFIKSMENLIKVVSRRFTYCTHNQCTLSSHLYPIRFIHFSFRIGRFALGTHDGNGTADFVRYFPLVNVCCCRPTTFFSQSFTRFATIFHFTFTLCKTFINKHCHTLTPWAANLHFLHVKLILSYQLIAWVCECVCGAKVIGWVIYLHRMYVALSMPCETHHKNGIYWAQCVSVYEVWFICLLPNLNSRT